VTPDAYDGGGDVVSYLTTEDLLVITENATSGQPLVRDFGLLESAAARPQTSVFGAEAYPDVWSKAAALGHSLIRNHPLIDGNKRLGWVAMRTFLELNGVPPFRADVDTAERFVLDVAAGELDDVNEIAKRLRALVD
jgi:death on curing protein